MREIIIIGAGGFGREVADIVHAINSASDQPRWRLLGIADDSPSEVNLLRLQQRSLHHLGSIDELIARPDRPHYVIGVGDPAARRDLANRLQREGFPAATLIHPDATIGSRVAISEGTILCAGVRLTTNIILGRHVHLNLNATVGHDTTIGDFVSINPLASISGDCLVETDALIGVAAILLNGIQVHTGAVVGGNSCVVNDVPPGATVKGVPAR